MRGIPFVVSASVAMPTVEGASVVADLSQMQIEHRTPIEIDEIRFMSDPGAPGISCHPAGVGVNLDAGPYKMTSDFVPLWAADPGYNAQFETMRGNVAAGLYDGPFFARWILPSPMVLPPGFVLKPQFKFLPDSAVNAANPAGKVGGAQTLGGRVTISIVGRALIDGKYPRTTRVPYVSAWLPYVTLNVATQNDERTLINDLSKVIQVHRLITHFPRRGYYDFMRTTNYPTNDFPLALTRTFEIKTSKGYNVTSEPIPAFLLFPPQQLSVPIERPLDPGEQIIVMIGIGTGTEDTEQVAFVATREEAI